MFVLYFKLFKIQLKIAYNCFGYPVVWNKQYENLCILDDQTYIRISNICTFIAYSYFPFFLPGLYKLTKHSDTICRSWNFCIQFIDLRHNLGLQMEFHKQKYFRGMYCTVQHLCSPRKLHLSEKNNLGLIEVFFILVQFLF